MAKRELLYVKGTGFICADCGWVFPVPGFSQSQEPSAEAKFKFDKHDCEKYPRSRKKEDFSQAAARIVKEATEQ